MPQGTKNSTQMSHFNETFERLTSSILEHAACTASSSAANERLDRMEESISKISERPSTSTQIDLCEDDNEDPQEQENDPN
ncbi:hypothetical protein MBANPS3_012422 [Mucor bainieri]